MSGAPGSAKRTLFRLEARIVSKPFTDRAPIDVRQVGLFSTLDGATTWLRANDLHAALALDPGRQRVLVVSACEVELGPVHRGFVRWVWLSARGGLLETDDSGNGLAIGDTPRREWRRGELAACISHGRYRVGVIFAAPPPADERSEKDDDYYLIDFGDDDFSHDHKPAQMLMPPLAPVPLKLRRRLQQRLRGDGIGEASPLPSPPLPPRGRDILPPGDPPPPVCCYQTDASFLFTSCGPQVTGIPGAELWFSEGEFARNPTPHGPRLLVVPGTRRPRPLARAVPVQITPPFQVYGSLPKKLARPVVRFIEQNQHALLANWQRRLPGLDLLEHLQRLSPSGQPTPPPERPPPPSSPATAPPSASESEPRRVVCVEATFARRRCVDGTPVDTYRLAHFERANAALRWARNKAAEAALDWEPVSGPLLAIHIVERQLDVGPRDYHGHARHSPERRLLEARTINDDIASWRGRAPGRCRWKPGDIVACVFGGYYRVGVVLERPWSRSWARRGAGVGLTRNDDVYLVGFVSGERDHAHLREGEMFLPVSRVSMGLRRGLGGRWREHREERAMGTGATAHRGAPSGV